MNTLQKTITLSSLIGSCIFIVLSFNVPELIVRFLLLGELPNDTTPLSPDTMLILLGIGAVAVLTLITPFSVVKAIQKLILTSVKLRLPKRRYTSI